MLDGISFFCKLGPFIGKTITVFTDETRQLFSGHQDDRQEEVLPVSVDPQQPQERGIHPQGPQPPRHRQTPQLLRRQAGTNFY